MAVIRTIIWNILVARIIEKSHEFVIFLMANGVIGMRVALHAAETCPLQSFPCRIHAVENRGGTKFFVLVGSIPVKGRRHIIRFAGVWQ